MIYKGIYYGRATGPQVARASYYTPGTLVAIAGNQGAYNNNEGIRGTLIRNKLLEVIRCRMSWYQLMMLHLKC